MFPCPARLRPSGCQWDWGGTEEEMVKLTRERTGARGEVYKGNRNFKLRGLLGRTLDLKTQSKRELT